MEQNNKYFKYISRYLGFKKQLTSLELEKVEQLFTKIQESIEAGDLCYTDEGDFYNLFIENISESIYNVFQEEAKVNWSSSEKLFVFVQSKNRNFTYYYLQKQWNNFYFLYRWFKEFLKTPLEINLIDYENLKTYMDIFGLKLNEGQKTAVIGALNSHFSIIQGGPGTGKTTVISMILFIICQIKPEAKVQLLAPTGKATSRLVESLEEGFENATTDAQFFLQKQLEKIATIHRFIAQYSRVWNNSFKNEDIQIDLDYLIMDETSMVSPSLFVKLLKWISPKTHLILIGDSKQLPSIEEGFLLQYFIEKKSIFNKYLFTLDTIMRSESKKLTQLITELQNNSLKTIENLSYIEYKTPDDWDYISKQTEGLFFIAIEDEKETTINNIWYKYLNEFYFTREENVSVIEIFKRYKKQQMLTPTHRGLMGNSYLNSFALSHLYKHYQSYSYPVLIKENNYSVGLFNGDLGVYYKSEMGQESLFFEKHQNTEEFLYSGLKNFIEPSFSITVHKSQGSEFDHVFLLLPSYILGKQFFSQELFYTGVSRAKKKLVLIGTKRVLDDCLKQNLKRNNGILL